MTNREPQYADPRDGSATSKILATERRLGAHRPMSAARRRGDVRIRWPVICQRRNGRRPTRRKQGPDRRPLREATAAKPISLDIERDAPAARLLGDTLARTSGLDRFSRESVIYTRAFTPPRCARSRAAITPDLKNGDRRQPWDDGDRCGAARTDLAVPPPLLRPFRFPAAAALPTTAKETDYSSASRHDRDEVYARALAQSRRQEPAVFSCSHRVTHDKSDLSASPAARGKPPVTMPEALGARPYYRTSAVRRELAR